MPEKSTIETSRKIFAMKASFKMLLSILGYYILGKIIVGGYNLASSFFLEKCIVSSSLSEAIFIACIAAIGTIVTALNIADGLKRNE